MNAAGLRIGQVKINTGLRTVKTYFIGEIAIRRRLNDALARHGGRKKQKKYPPKGITSFSAGNFLSDKTAFIALRFFQKQYAFYPQFVSICSFTLLIGIMKLK